MTDPLLALETSSEEEAAWLETSELDQDMAVWFVRRAQAMSRGYVLAAREGRADLAVGDVMGSLVVDRLSAEAVLAEALQLVAQPATVTAIEDRRLPLPHARALLDVLIGLPPAVADQVEAAVLRQLTGRSPARIRELARREALRIDPAGMAERRRQAGQARKMSLRDAGDGMVSMMLLMRAEQGLAVMHRAERETAHDDGSGRSRDQRRLDWLVETLLADPATAPPASAPPDAAPTDAAPTDAAPGAELVLDGRRRRPVQVLVHIPVTTALGLDDEPCELAEIGPIDAEHGRLLLSTAELRKVCIDARTGQVLHVEDTVHRPVPDPTRIQRLGGGPQAGAQALAEAVRQALIDMVSNPSVMPVDAEPQYRPSAALSRTLKTRHPRCDFLTCATCSRACDDEHTVPYPRGQTSADNMVPRSPACHHMKHRGWIPRPLPDGTTLWLSPSGRQYPSPAQHAPPPPVAPDAKLPPPRPPGPRDDDGPVGDESDQPWLPPAPTPPPPAPPARSTWPDEAPF